MIGTRVRRALLAAALVLVALAVIVHTPPFRALVLRYAIRTVQDRYGIHIAASGLDYNVASLHVALSDVRMSASGDSAPFFEADRVDVDLARSALVGDVAFRQIASTRARVTVLRRADGTTNLPRSSGEPGEPAALRITRLVAPSMRIEFRDQQANFAVTIPDVSIDLGQTAGRVAIGMAARLTYGGTSTEVSRFAGDASFDGRDLHLSRLQVAATEGTAQIDGVLRVIRRETGLDVRVTSTLALPQVARWGLDPQQAPSGSVAVSGRVSGPFDALSADMTVTSDAVAWSGLQASQVKGQAQLAADRLTISEGTLRFANGRVDVRGEVPFDASQQSALHLSWSGVDINALVSRLAPAATVRPAGSMSGSLDARGSGELRTWSADGQLRIDAAANARGRLAIPGDTRLRLAQRTVRIDGEHRVAGIAPVALTLRARLDSPELTSASLSGSMRVAPTSLPGLIDALAVVGIARVPSDLLTGGSLEGAAAIAGSLSAPRIRFRASTVDAAAVRGAVGHIKATGEYDVARAGYQVTAMLADWAISPQPDRPLRATVSGELTVEGRGAHVSGEGDLLARNVTWSDIAIGPIDVHLTLANEVAHVRAQVPEFALTAEGDVGTTAPYRSAITAMTSNLDLSRALRDVDLPQPVTGKLSAHVQASGDMQQWRAGRAQVEVSDLEAHAADLTLGLREPIQARYENERVEVDRLEARVAATGNARGAGTLVSVSGALPIDTASPANGRDSLLATVTGDVGEVLEAVRSARLADVPSVTAGGPFVLLARITGTATAPTYSADLELGPARATIRDDLPPLENVRLRAHLENDIVELREAGASYAGAMLDASARSPLALLLGTSSSGTLPGTAMARVRGLTPAALQGLVAQSTLDQLSGTVDASVDLTLPVGRALSGPADPTLSGPAQRVLEDLEGELRLDRFDVAVAGLPLTQREPTRVRLERGLARIESWEWVGQGRSLSVAGQMRLSDRQVAVLASGDLDVGLLAPFVRTTGVSIAGRLQPRLSITGAVDNPRLDGDATVTGGEVRIRDPRVVLSDVTARAVLAGRSVHLLSLTGAANGGALQANGSIDFPSDAPLGAQLAATVTGMPIEFPQGLRSEVNADLSLALAGTAGASSPSTQTVADQISGGTLSGTVTVLRSAYRDPLPVVAGLLASARARNTTVGGTQSPMLEKLALDVRVVTDEDLIVDNNAARVQMGGDLRVIGTAAAPSLSGRVEIRDGGQLYLGRNVYRLEEPGTIDFSNPVLIEPNLNITAVTRAGGEDITVKLSGTPDTLSPELSSESNSSLGQADLAALLLTGRTLDRLPDDQAAVIGAELLSNVSGDVLGFAGRAVGLDVLRLGGVATTGARRDTTDLATELDPTTRLTFGKSLGRNVEVTLSQSLRDGDAQTWIVDYLPARQLALRFVSNDEDLRSYEFRHDLSFGGGTPGRRSVIRTTRPVPPRVSTVTITGDLVFPEAQLRKELSLDAGDRFDFIAWQTDRDRLQDFYIAHRHLAARITASRAGDAHAVALTYTVTAGPETAIVVTGFTIDRSVIHDIEGAWAISVVDELLLDQSQDIVREVLVQQGYPRASVSASLDTVAEIRTLTIAVTPGPKAEPSPESAPAKASPKVGAVAFVRSPAPAVATRETTDDSLRSTADLSSGAPADVDAIEEARDRVQRLYRREGFATARVTVRQEVHPGGGTSDVTFDIVEGPRQVVGEVVIEGNRGIDTDVIARAVRLEVGQPLRAQDWLDARRRVFDTALFRRVDVRSEPMDSTDATARMRMRVVVEEWPALRLRYGFQAAEERPEGSLTGRNIVPGLSADLTRRTLFGRAVSAVAAVELQRRDRSARGTLNAPTFLRLPLSSSLVLERARQEFAAATLVTDRGGVSWEQRSRLASDRLNLSYTYRFERNHTFDTEPPTNPLFPAFDITINIARLTAVGAWDSRDDAGDTTRGSLLSYTFEYAPASLGSDIRFVRQLTQAYYFRSWRGVVFGSAARLGFVSPLGGQELIPSERFFSGGARSVRGVAEDGLGPRDFFGDPAGGEALLILNQEARFPIYRWLRGVGFVDAGNVFQRPGDFGFGNLVGAAGGGLRLVTPVALLRVDYGRQMWPGPRQGTGRWFFGIGQSF